MVGADIGSIRPAHSEAMCWSSATIACSCRTASSDCAVFDRRIKDFRNSEMLFSDDSISFTFKNEGKRRISDRPFDVVSGDVNEAALMTTFRYGCSAS